MKMANIIVIAIVSLCAVFAITSIIKNRKKCCGCDCCNNDGNKNCCCSNKDDIDK